MTQFKVHIPKIIYANLLKVSSTNANTKPSFSFKFLLKVCFTKFESVSVSLIKSWLKWPIVRETTDDISEG